MEKFDFTKPFSKSITNRINEYIGQVIALVFVFILFCAIGFGLALIDPLLLYVTIPLIVLPALFSLQSGLTFLIAGKGISNRITTSFYFSYFVPPFKGCLRVVISFLKSLLVFIVASFVCGGIYYAIASATSPDFADAINKVAEYLSLQNLEPAMINEAVNFIFTNSSLVSYYYCIQGISTGLASIYFIYLIFFNTLNAHLRSKVGGPSSAALNSLFKSLVSSDRKLYYGTYSVRNIPLFILFGLGFSISFACFGLFLPTMPNYAEVVSLFAGTVAACLYIPYTLVSNDLFMRNNSISIKKFFIDFSIKSLEEMKAKAVFSQEQLDKANSSLQEAEKLLEDEMKKEKEKENQENKDDSPNDENK